jgi:hypothetical protein
MSPEDFVAVLENQLRLQGLQFSRADLMAFVASAWPLIDDDPDVWFWAGEFVTSGLASVTT